jgi:hypothetical protein
LRRWALARPFVQILVDHLPHLPEGGPAPGAGLYIDAKGVQWLNGKGETRVSVARFHAVNERGERRLLAQLHVTSRHASDGTEDRRVRYYIHDLDGPAIEELWTEEEWWLTLLDRHYGLGGPPVDLGPGCEA